MTLQVLYAGDAYTPEGAAVRARRRAAMGAVGKGQDIELFLGWSKGAAEYLNK